MGVVIVISALAARNDMKSGYDDENFYWAYAEYAEQVFNALHLKDGQLKFTDTASAGDFEDIWVLARINGREYSLGDVDPRASEKLDSIMRQNFDFVYSTSTLGPLIARRISGHNENIDPSILNGEVVIGGFDAGSFMADSAKPYALYFWEEINWLFRGWPMLFFVIGSPVILFIIVSLMTAPLQRAARTAQRIHPGDLKTRLEIKNLPTEVKPLAFAVNEALDRLETGYRSLSHFTAGAAHELRTPLALIDVYLKDIPPSESLDKVQKTTMRLGNIVDQILALASIRQDMRTYNSVDLVMLVREVAADRAPLADAQGIELEVVPEVDELRIPGLEAALFAALANLIDNAILHAKDTPCITLRIVPNGVDVVDYGAGVSKEIADSLFEPFVRDKAEKGSSGFGLGLSIVREIINRHNGDIRMTQNPDAGTTFSIRFKNASDTPDRKQATSNEHPVTEHRSV